MANHTHIWWHKMALNLYFSITFPKINCFESMGVPVFQIMANYKMWFVQSVDEIVQLTNGTKTHTFI